VDTAKTNLDQVAKKPYQQTLTPQKVIPSKKHLRSKSSMMDEPHQQAFADMFHH
jgi:hypothetical protein